MIPLEVVSNSIAGGRGSGASYEFYKVIQSDWEFATDSYTPLTFVDKHAVAPADLSQVRWVSHCRELVQLPVAA